MIVTDSTTVLKFPLRNDTFIGDDATIKIINESTKAEVYNDTLAVAANSYYYEVEDLSGFNLTDNQNYILEVYLGGNLEYRSTLYCVNSLPKVYNTEKRINTPNDYITI